MLKPLSQDEDGVLQTPEEWARWIAEQESRTLQVYKVDPDRLIADYRHERQISRDYQGREILELLQNANDAAAEKNIKGHVRIELHEAGLIVANTGLPFSTGGVNSLRISDLSPKLRRKTKLIGQKGLGFRAVLNWSRHPFILTGALRLTYNKSKSQEIVSQLTRENTAIKRLVENESRTPNEAILATLPFPAILDTTNQDPQEDPQDHQQILQRCVLIRQEYDTVVGMPFDRPEVFELAKNELDQLRPEILLFTENLEEITISFRGKDSERWKLDWKDDVARLIKNERDTNFSWKVYRVSDTVPLELAVESSSNDYQIVIAVPLGDMPSQPAPLFSYFPTDVEFPFPVVCHATLELETNRKRPQAGQPNEFIFDRVAGLLNEIAEKRTSETDLWIKARTLARTQEYDFLLQRFGFGIRLLGSAKGRNIIPTISRAFAKPGNLKRLKATDLSWLPESDFSDICLPSTESQIDRLLDELGILTLSFDELRERLNKLAFASIEQRASVIAGLIKHTIVPTGPPPELLIDTEQQVIRRDQRVYLLPEQHKKYDLPSWMNLRFLNETLREKLGELIGAKDRRELRQRLEVFGVQEYALSNVASAIVAEAKRKMAKDEQKALDTQQEMLMALFFLFPQSGEPPKLAETTGVPLLNMRGTFADSREMYFGAPFPENGDLLSALYKSEPEKLIASLEGIGIKCDDQRTIAFLRWLGVSSLPRDVIYSNVESEFLDYVLDNVSYPLRADKYIRLKKEDFYRAELTNVRSIDGLDVILEAEPSAILTWLAIDGRASNWRIRVVDNAKLLDQPPWAGQRTYTTPIPSYVRWKIQNTKWLPTVIGAIEKPVRCMLGERGLEKLLPPPTEFKHPLFEKYQIQRLQLRNAWENAGVMPDVSHLDAEQVFKILNELPSSDPEGKYAHTFYRSLLERIDPERINWPEVPDWFQSIGKMWGTGHDGQNYYPVKELYHADYEDFPEILCKHLNLVDLPKRVGAQKVKKMFGIEPIDRKKIHQTITRAVELPESKDIQAQFQRKKPCLYYLRNVRTRQSSDLKALELLEIVLCSTIEVEIDYQNLKLTSELDSHLQWTLEDNRAFVLYTSGLRPSLESDLLTDVIGAIVANVFNLSQGGDFARLIRCSEHDQESLLKRILGESDIPGIDTIRKEFDQVTKELPINIPLALREEDRSQPGSTELESVAGTPETPRTDKADVTITDRGDGIIKATETPHTPSSPPSKRSTITRTHKGKQSGGGTKGMNKIVDWKVCEQRAAEFEKLEGRITLSVSRIVGYDGPRCDLLSFGTEDDLNTFINLKEPGKRNLSLVKRFIEVKGRTSEDSPISLKGNELDAAKTYGEQYYFYRLYLVDVHKYVLLILRDPLSHPEALETVKDVYVSRASEVERYDLEIMTENDKAKEQKG